MTKELRAKLIEQLNLAEEFGFDYVFIKIGLDDAAYILSLDMPVKDIKFTGIGKPTYL